MTRPRRIKSKRPSRSSGRIAGAVKVKGKTVSRSSSAGDGKAANPKARAARAAKDRAAAVKAEAGNTAVAGKQIGSGAKGKSGNRDLKTRVRTAKGRTTSSTKWLQRQLNDPYVAKARTDGLRSRAAYKLIELNERHKLIEPHMRVVDLGCAPGGWCQVVAKITGASEEDPRIVGIDPLEMEPMAGVRFLQKDFAEEDAPDMLVSAMGGQKADLVLSDMAAPTTGHRPTDHLRIVFLCEIAADFAVNVLNPGGTFVAKVFQGGTEGDLLAKLKRHFSSTFHAKPPASRADSAETYLIARGFRGDQDT